MFLLFDLIVLYNLITQRKQEEKEEGGRNRTDHSRPIGQNCKSNINVIGILEEKRVYGAEEYLRNNG